MTGRLSGLSLVDIVMAALAAVAVAFVAFVMPDGLIVRIVNASGVVGLVEGSEIGTGARAAMAACGAAIIFAGLLLLFGAMPGDTKPRPASARPETPRVRRADAHADAPPPRPLFAEAELGLPAEQEPLMELNVPEPTVAPEPIVAPAQTPPADLSPIRTVPLPSDPVDPAAQSIDELLARIEAGIAARSTAGDSAEAVEPEPDPIDDRLRSAISDLQRLARRS